MILVLSRPHRAELMIPRVIQRMQRIFRIGLGFQSSWRRMNQIHGFVMTWRTWRSHWLITQSFLSQVDWIRIIIQSHGAWKCRQMAGSGLRFIAARTTPIWMAAIKLACTKSLHGWDVDLFVFDKRGRITSILTTSDFVGLKSLASFMNDEPVHDPFIEWTKSIWICFRRGFYFQRVVIADIFDNQWLLKQNPIRNYYHLRSNVIRCYRPCWFHGSIEDAEPVPKLSHVIEIWWGYLWKNSVREMVCGKTASLSHHIPVHVYYVSF
jgi:hypothetical protein